MEKHLKYWAINIEKQAGCLMIYKMYYIKDNITVIWYQT